jgi:valyl-tRNA synthetase
MMLDREYDPKDIEQRWYETWLEKKYFHAGDDGPAQGYAIVIPPPNVTGVLHMGHALNNTLQDIMIRYKRMDGFDALWMPGTDHAGIATQNVVEKYLAEKGKSRHDLGGRPS